MNEEKELERELSLEELDKVCMYNADREFVIDRNLELEDKKIFRKEYIERLKQEKEEILNSQRNGRNR